MDMMKRLSCALVFGTVALTAAGCTSTRGNGNLQSLPPKPAPAAASFAAGACRTAADDVIGVWNMGGQVRGRTDMTTDERSALETRQNALIAAMKGASPQVRSTLQDLVTALGFARLRLDIRTYEPSLMDDVMQADQAVQTTCVR